jgi:mRNA interferase MazF
MIDPARVSLTCRNGHSHFYDLDAPGEIDCKVSSCSSVINSSRVTRGIHPYIIMTGDKFQDESGYIQTFTVIPLTSKTTFSGLPDVYPITRTARNALTCKSYALVHQICTVDANCFKNHVGSWRPRVGQLDKRDKEGINKRLKYFLGFDSNPEDDWFKQNATPELAQKIYGYLSESEKNRLLGSLLDTL